MEIGLGAMRFSPAEFWSMTMPEFRAAFAGWKEARGQGKGGGYAPAPVRAELDDMMRRFPD